MRVTYSKVKKTVKRYSSTIKGVESQEGRPWRLSIIASRILSRIHMIRVTSNAFPAGVSDSKIMTYSLCFSG